jgi:hypothetical protein
MSIVSRNGSGGRLGNQIIRNLCVSEIAKKNDLFVYYSNFDIINNKLGIPLFIGKKNYDKKIILNRDNYFSIFNSPGIEYNLDAWECFFQTKDISAFLYMLLRNEYKNSIMNKNKFISRYNNNNDIFIHVRLGDVISKNPGLQYYLHALQSINNYANIIIASDSPTHNIVKRLLTLKNSKLLYENEINTIQFASTCKYIVLSGGTFSNIIGYLGFYSTVYYPCFESTKEKNLVWYGDVQTIDNWIPIKF